MVTEKRPQSSLVIHHDQNAHREAGCIYAIITGKRPVSRRNRASWYLSQLNKVVNCDPINSIEEPEHDDCQQDIGLVSITCKQVNDNSNNKLKNRASAIPHAENRFLVTPNTRVSFLSRSIATSIILDLSPSIVSVNSENGCVFLDTMFDTLKRTLHLLVKSHEIPTSTSGIRPWMIEPRVFISVIAYTPFIIAKNNQVIVQNRKISVTNVDQVLIEIWLCLTRLTYEIHDLVSGTCGVSMGFDLSRATSRNVFVFPHLSSNTIMRHPGSVLEDIYELGLFASGLMPKLSRLSIIIISDGLFASTNDLNIFRIKSIAVSFISLAPEVAHPNSCFGYIPYTDLMKFVAKTTSGFHTTHQEFIDSSSNLSRSKQIPLLMNPLYKLFRWTLHSEEEELTNSTPEATNFPRSNIYDCFNDNFGHVARFFTLDQPVKLPSSSEGNQDSKSNQNYLDWRLFKQLDRNLDADFEQVLACLLREGYLIKSIQFKHNEQTRIVTRLVLHWRHNLDLEQELTAPYCNSTDPFDLGDTNQLMMRPYTAPIYGDTYCEIFVHGSYSFLHNLYCNRRLKRRSEYRDIAYRQFRQLIDCILQTHERLQYLSQFYRDSSLSKVPSYLLHGNSLLYEQPHTHKLTSTIDNVIDETKTNEFLEYWQKISCLDTKSWKNIMHVHTLRLILEHDQPKHKNIQHQNTSGRYTHIQCRRSLSAISNFIKSYASFALLEDSTYVKFIYNSDDDLREIETSATKGFIVIRVNKLLPIVVVHLMFTSGILDSHRVQIVSYLEEQLTGCKLRSPKISVAQMDNLLKCKTISSSSESCCISIKSPLERMLKVYSRNFIVDFLVNNWAHGLPGSCPYSNTQSITKITKQSTNTAGLNNQSTQAKDSVRADNSNKSITDDYSPDNNNLSRYNLVFGKYLYGIRMIHTIVNLPHDIIPYLTANVLSKISAILVNIRIKQGFHIAFNSSGILNLVAELTMRDPSNEDHTSSCLCQYIVFPPTVVNSNQTNIGILGTASGGNINQGIPSSIPGSLNGSLANSESLIRNSVQDTVSLNKVDNGEVKIIREYWIEQQYGISAASEVYHNSLKNKRYSEILDHLFLSDTNIFECLMTYDILQLLCDKMSPHSNLDTLLNKTIARASPPPFSPAISTASCDMIEDRRNSGQTIPSNLIEGTGNDGVPKTPLIESEYKFSLVKFLDYCQLAGLNILLFKDASEFFSPNVEKRTEQSSTNTIKQETRTEGDGQVHEMTQLSRKMSADFSDHDGSVDHINSRREHRSSYQSDSHGGQPYIQTSAINSKSLNHLFLDTLHRRFKQMHDKELRLSDDDLEKLPAYLIRRKILNKVSGSIVADSSNESTLHDTCDDSDSDIDPDSLDEYQNGVQVYSKDNHVEWRCFLRKANQENLMIILIPNSLEDVHKWLELTSTDSLKALKGTPGCDINKSDLVCPMFAFRCSSTMINDQVLSFMREASEQSLNRSNLEGDLSFHFGQVCRYMNKLITLNDELNNDILSIARYGSTLNQTTDEKTLEVVHFRAFLRKIKNTVLKSRYSSLNDAYLSELFVHKDDILYYINNVDLDTQKKYHVSSNLRNLAEFVKNYEEYNDLLPTEPGKPCNKLLNSILLQKCGLFINQPIARYDESNPLMKHLYDRKLLFMMRCNYKIELPILEETLAKSSHLKNFIKPAKNVLTSSPAMNNSPSISQEIPVEVAQLNSQTQQSMVTSSLGKSTEGSKLMEMKCGSVGTSGSILTGGILDKTPMLRHSQTSRFGGSNSGFIGSVSPSLNDSFILEAFRSSKVCSIEDIPKSEISTPIEQSDIGLRHEAHLAEVLRRSRERKDSHHYRRVLKSKGTYNQSHSAIDQALKKVDSLGRLEHFCLSPLLFSTNWRFKLAPVRDHTIETSKIHSENKRHHDSLNQSRGSGETIRAISEADTSSTNTDVQPDPSMMHGDQQMQSEMDERWHQNVCNNYIKEYEQYIQTLGFNSVQIRQQSSLKTSTSASVSSIPPTTGSPSTTLGISPSSKRSYRNPSSTTNIVHLKSRETRSSRKGSVPTSSLSTAFSSSNTSTYDTGYLIKFLNGGCLVFKVGFCKPYVYSILYSIEGERFNNSSTKMNMATFLDELDNIKVTLHLHSFTYDYHLRAIYSYISGRQLIFSPGYHLISFLDDFRKYYQKAPNYARNHILCGEICISDIKVTGQQLYNYIVTHNSTYNMDVIEMSSSFAKIVSSISSRGQTDEHRSENTSLKDVFANDSYPSSRSHANDYLLVELKREKVRYRDGKDSDIFDCALLITHDFQAQNQSTRSSSLNLKYFLLLTNQRDLYPKLIHTYDSIISLGCHRPIRLGVATMKPDSNPLATTLQTPSLSVAPSSDLDDIQSSELQSSGEVSGPTSIVSATAVSVQSSNSGGLQFGSIHSREKSTSSGCEESHTQTLPAIRLEEPIQEATEALQSNRDSVDGNVFFRPSIESTSLIDNNLVSVSSSIDERSTQGDSTSPTLCIKDNNKKGFDPFTQGRTICDEEITYLGYFSSDEMDMLRFLQAKTDSLKSHIQQVVRLAEIHYQRDFLWHKLMQRTTPNNKSDDIPLAVEELIQLLAVVEAIDLSVLDPQLSTFSSMHMNWQTKLVKAFGDLKQSSHNQHRIYFVKASKLLILYIDPKCTTAFILMSIDSERCLIEQNLLMKDKQDCTRVTASVKNSSRPSSGHHSPEQNFELDSECQQIINDYVNFCATFMWSTFITQ